MGCLPMSLGRLLGSTWRLLGALQESFWRGGSLLGTSGGPREDSWDLLAPLGMLLDALGALLDALGALLDDFSLFGDDFSKSLVEKGQLRTRKNF